MKVKCIAVLLSLSLLTPPVFANIEKTKTTDNHPASIVKPININKANEAELTGSFKGIGKKRAQAIIDYRQAHKGFKSLEELAEVKGIGQHFVDSNREKLKQIYVIQ